MTVTSLYDGGPAIQMCDKCTCLARPVFSTHSSSFLYFYFLQSFLTFDRTGKDKGTGFT